MTQGTFTPGHWATSQRWNRSPHLGAGPSSPLGSWPDLVYKLTVRNMPHPHSPYRVRGIDP
jgi:hypothetical protein